MFFVITPYRIRIFIAVLVICLTLPGCLKKKTGGSFISKKIEFILAADQMPNPDKPITIIVHGTRMPPPLMIAVPGLARQVVTPSGLHKAATLDSTYLYARNARVLDKTDPEQFPLENIYLFGWSGILSFGARKKAAERLYGYINQIRRDARYARTPITVVPVSHGGNVGLNLGAVAEEKGDARVLVDRLVLLCSPMQDATERHVNSPIFGTVFNLYSSGELIQVLDPQGMYDKAGMGCSPLKFFSHRVVGNASSHVVQVEVQHKKRTLCHVDFAMPHFTKRLANVLRFIEDDKKRNQLPRNSDGAFVLDLNQWIM